MGCWGCGMLGMWNVGDVGCGMFAGMWNVDLQNAGFTVLQLSKWLMYDFHYNFIKRYLDAELLFTDTDGLT